MAGDNDGEINYYHRQDRFSLGKVNLLTSKIDLSGEK